MKKLEKLLLLIAVACATVSFAHAADVALYTAYASPGVTPDANAGAVDVWTVTGDGGADRSYLQGMQDGNAGMWTIWDLNGGGGTYAMHTFAGGALEVGQSVSIDWAHNRNIEGGRSIGIRLLDGTGSQVEVIFQGGKQVFSKYDTGSGAYEDISKWYDRYDIFQVVFTLTGTNTYAMHITEGSIADNPAGWGNDRDDGNAEIGPIVDQWTGSFTGSAITGIQVYTEGGNDSDQWFDNLSINDDWLNNAHDQYPVNRQELVPISGLELSWAIPQVRTETPGVVVTDPNLVSFNLYYQDGDPNLADVTPISVTAWNTETNRASYIPSPQLNKNGSYYWRVDAVLNDSSVRQGTEWVFYTEFSKPIIVTQPSVQIVDGGQPAVFTVVVDSQTPASYQWYKYVDGTNDILLTDGGDISGAMTGTLSIAGAALEDEGGYYCIVNNESQVAVTTNRAPLGIKRKIAYWPFDGGVMDSTIPGSPVSVIVGDPNVAAGIVGDAMAFDDGVDMLYTDPYQTSYFDICDYEMTVACWVKTTDRQGWCPLVAKNGESGQGWQLRQSGHTDDRPCFTTRGTGNEDGTPANRSIYDGNWHYVVGTFDGTIKKVYIDGVLSRRYSMDDGSLQLEGDAVTAPIGATQSPVAIAGRVSRDINHAEGLNVETGNIVAGIYDEVEIYNFALDAETIAKTYADLTGSNVCLGQAYDLDNDCTVDLNDLGMLATEWLNSAIVKPAL